MKKVSPSVISFDLWGTLIESNPNFKSKREQIIRNTLKKYRFFRNSKSVDTLDISKRLGTIKKEVDALVEAYGLSATPYQLYEGVFTRLIQENPDSISKNLSPELLHQIVDEILTETEKLMQNPENLPNLIANNTQDSLSRLLDADKHLVVMSNTMNMSGAHLRHTLESRLSPETFSEFFFSDQVGASKPSPTMYKNPINFAQQRGKNASSVLHIGDNHITDGGVIHHGMQFAHISPKDSTRNLGAIVSAIIEGKIQSFSSQAPIPLTENKEEFDTASRRLTAQEFSNRDDMNFSPHEYSRFKFGSKEIAKKFGEELADKFIHSHFFEEVVEGIKKGQKIFIISSPYVHIPTATFAMKDYFLARLNQVLIAKRLETVMETKLSRRSSYAEEYGEMNAEERSQVMQNDIFHVDHELIRGNIVLFIDDIIITGGHEKRIVRMMEHYGLTHAITPIFMYYAMLTDKSTDPKIENFLNYAAARNLLDLNAIIANEAYALNTRMVKYILNAPHAECKVFLQYQKDVFLHTLHTAALGNRYHTIPVYAENLAYLVSLLKSKGLLK